MATIYGTSHYSYFGGHVHLIGNDDNLYGTSSGDYIDAGTGNDTVFAGFGNDTVYGGYGNDYLSATDGSGSVAAWGNDWVSGGSGDDTIDYVGTTSAVTLYGDDGQDMIFGGSAGDWISGGSGDDYLQGNAGNDTVWGGDGSDLIDGNSGADSLVGGRGDDYIWGGTGPDLLWGEDDNDILYGGNDVDELYGGAGDDDLNGGTGGDWLWGGDGADTFHLRVGDTGLTWDRADTIMDFNPREDSIAVDVAGSYYVAKLYAINPDSGWWVDSSDYYEVDGASMLGTGFDAARNEANDRYWWSLDDGSPSTYLFETDGVNGYLFVDQNHDGWADAGVEILGITNWHQAPDLFLT